MTETYVIEDLFNTLIALEEYGAQTYNALSEKANDMETHKLFKELAKQEEGHKRFYLKLKDKFESNELVNDEYTDYIKILIRNSFFTELKTQSNFGFDEAIELAINLEKETLLFLNETRTLVDSFAAKALEQVIMEERRHLSMLFNLKEKRKLQL